MTFDNAVDLAREITSAGHTVCTVSCLYGGGRVGVAWSVGFRPHPDARGMQSASSRGEWAYWQSERGQARMRATLPETARGATNG
jgi:hypothetical protein